MPPVESSTKRRYLYTVLTSPVLLLGLLSLMVALSWLGFQRVPAQTLDPIVFEVEAQQFEEADITLRFIQDDGLESSRTVSMLLSSNTLERLTQVLQQLRLVLVEVGQWPSGLPVPELFWLEWEGRKIVVLDVQTETQVAVDVQTESKLKRAIEMSLAAQGVDEVYYLREGLSGSVFLEHLAVRASLD